LRRAVHGRGAPGRWRSSAPAHLSFLARGDAPGRNRTPPFSHCRVPLRFRGTTLGTSPASRPDSSSGPASAPLWGPCARWSRENDVTSTRTGRWPKPPGFVGIRRRRGRKCPTACPCGRHQLPNGLAGLRGAANPFWVGAAATYDTVHNRLKRDRGPASSHECVDCGKAARDWSYDGGAPDERKAHGGQSYSPDPAFYSPRCRRCHRAHDAQGASPCSTTQSGTT
jgi:hypothetical protein